MAVRLRMMRMGRKNRPYYRIGAFDAHESGTERLSKSGNV